MRAAETTILVIWLMALLPVGGCVHRAAPLVAGPTETTRLLASQPADPTGWLRRGWTRLLRRNDLIGALADLDRAAEFEDLQPDLRMLARLGAGLIHLMQADFPKAQEAFLAALESDCTSPEGLVAAGQLREVTHQIPEGHRQIESRLRSLLERTPPPSAEIARAIRQILRDAALRAGDFESVRGIDKELGVPNEWMVAGPFGRRPLVDFQREFGPEQNPLRPAKGIQLVPGYPENGRLVLPDIPGPGLVYAQCYLRAIGAPARMILRIEGSGPWAVYLDGVLINTHDTRQRILPRVAWIPWHPLPGWHRLVLKTLGGPERGPLSVEVLSMDGKPSELQFQKERAAWQKPSAVPPGGPAWSGGARQLLGDRAQNNPRDALAPMMAAILDWDDGDPNTARIHLRMATQRSEEFGFLRYLQALVVLDDPQVPARMDSQSSRKHLTEAIKKCPDLLLARFRLALLEWNDGHDKVALEALVRLEAARPGVFLWPYFKGMIFQKLGWDLEADRAFRLALERLPDQPELIKTLFERSVQSNQTAESLHLAGLLEDLGLADSQLATFWISREENDRARKLLERLIRQAPSRMDNRLALVDLLTAQNQLTDAEKALDEAERLAPGNPRVFRARANLYELEGQSEQARKVRDRLRRFTPWSVDNRLALAVATNDLKKTRLIGERIFDARKVISDYQQSLSGPNRFKRDGNAVLVLDQASVEVAADGSSLERTHLIVQVLTPEGLEQWGEIDDIPSTANIREIRTITADGKAHDAEVYPGKQAISLPALQVGDFVEVSYLLGNRASGDLERGGFQARRWYFQAAGTPIFRSLYSVAVPRGTRLEIDSHGDVPAPQKRVEDGFDVTLWEKTAQSMLIPEPNAPPLDDYTPFVQVGFRQSWKDYRDLLRADLDLATRPNIDLIEFSRAILKNISDPRERLKRVFREVCSRIRQVGPANDLAQPAAHILALREGNRLVLLTALLKIMGYQPQVWLVRTIAGPQVDYRFPNRKSFSHGIIVLDIGRGDQRRRFWLDPAEKYNPFDVLYPFLRGRPALDVNSPRGSDPFCRTPRNPAPSPAKEILLELALDKDGNLQGTGREQLTTAQAANYRKLLGSMSPTQQQQVLQAGLGNYFSGAILLDHKISGLSDPDQPLTLEYRIEVPAFARNNGNHLVISEGFYPYRLGPNLTTKPERKLPLVLGDETRTHTRVRLKLPAGSRVSYPQKADLHAPLSRFTFSAHQDGGLLEIDKSLVVEAGRVTTAEYPEFRDFCKQVDQKDAEEIVVQLTP